VIVYSLPSPLDHLSRRERGPFRTPGLWLPLARAERGREGQGSEGMFKPKTDITENIGLFAVSYILDIIMILS
jgi:hypothetical protein